MAEADWTLLTGSLSAGSVDRGVTAGIAKPNGGGAFIYGLNTLDVSPGVVALYANQTNFAPMAKGCSISGAIQRGVSGGPLNFAPFLFASLGGPATTDLAYMLGLSDADPHRIVLRKGPVAGGLPDAAVGTSGILARSTETFTPGTWLHLRLDVVVNLNGDVVLNVFRNVLADNPVTAPVWTAVAGIAPFIDDALQVNTGSPPLTSGRAGFGGETRDVTRRMFFDQLTIARQL